MSKRLKRFELEAVYETTVSTEDGFDFAGQKIPEGWSLVVDVEGDLVCAVPPSYIGHRGPNPGPARPGDAEDSRKRAYVIAEILNEAEDFYPFADPEDGD